MRPRHIFCSLALCLIACGTTLADPIDVGSRRELFIDDALVDSMENVTLKVHQPVRKEVSIKWDKPWEGSGCGYTTVFQDGDKYRMYYKSWNHPGRVKGAKEHPLVIGYAESADGVHWTRPNLGLYEFEGSKENNITLDRIADSECHDFSPFIDLNPEATPEGKYKAIGVKHAGKKDRGLWAFQSPDGINWTPMKDGAVYTQGAFDTQNIAYYCEQEGQYVLYYRVFIEGVRHIEKAVSDDFVNWTRIGPIQFPRGDGPTPQEAFYVNQIKPYYRAPHILIGFPARYCDRGLTASTYELPEPELRKERVAVSRRYGTAVTDTVLITSRDGINFQRPKEPFLPPGLRTRYNWSYGDNYIAWHVVETGPTEDDMPRELSLYSTEAYFTEDWSRLRRFTLRIDGFVSAHADHDGGELLTKPFTFAGKRLSLNMATSAAGLVQVELQTAEGEPLEGFALADADPLYGDTLDRTVSWKGNTDVSALAGKPIRMRFVLKEADVYSWKFEE